MIFLRNENFRGYIRLYPVTAIILAINLIVFLANKLIYNDQLMERGLFYLEPVFNRYGMDEPWRFVTSIALHANWEHLLFNCFSILVFAPPLERLLGHIRYFFLYLIAGIVGNILTVIVHVGSEYATVGASGAIYGVFGAFLFLALFRKSILDEATRKTIYTMLIFGLVYSIFMPGINIWAHIGGAIAGWAMMGMLVLGKGKARTRSR